MKGFYSVIKYIPKLTRDENINIGVLLFSPQENKLIYKLDTELALKKMAFFSQEINCNSFKSLIDDFFNSIDGITKNVSLPINPLEELAKLFNTSIKISSYKTYIIEDLEQDLESLFDEQVSIEEDALRKRIASLVHQEAVSFYQSSILKSGSDFVSRYISYSNDSLDIIDAKINSSLKQNRVSYLKRISNLEKAVSIEHLVENRLPEVQFINNHSINFNQFKNNIIRETYEEEEIDLVSIF
ncbi:DUF3037 domain-containing protein [Robertmurraya sp. P23]|uniref:DUF3037 domain-containing protein n=1 Tax=Robertmurraya sp. P23 TaxID=3436931 RepID=UPI003D97EDC7